MKLENKFPGKDISEEDIKTKFPLNELGNTEVRLVRYQHINMFRSHLVFL